MLAFFYAKITLEFWQILVLAPGFAFLVHGLLGFWDGDNSPAPLHKEPMTPRPVIIQPLISPALPPLLTEQQKAFLAGFFRLHLTEAVLNRLNAWVKSPWFHHIVLDNMTFDEWGQALLDGSFDKITMMGVIRNFGPRRLLDLEKAIEKYLAQKNSQELPNPGTPPGRM